jgi:hypothetical protein
MTFVTRLVTEVTVIAYPSETQKVSIVLRIKSA